MLVNKAWVVSARGGSRRAHPALSEPPVLAAVAAGAIDEPAVVAHLASAGGPQNALLLDFLLYVAGDLLLEPAAPASAVQGVSGKVWGRSRPCFVMTYNAREVESIVAVQIIACKKKSQVPI